MQPKFRETKKVTLNKETNPFFALIGNALRINK